MSIDEQGTRIAGKLRRAQRSGGKSGREPAEILCLARSRPVRESPIAAFEERHGIELPADYRWFLVNVGTGSGPYYGIVPLDDLLETFWEEAGDGLLRTPFPFAPGAHREQCKRRGGEAGDDDEIFPGAISICHQGCSFFVLLVLAGPARGRVAYVDISDSDSCYFVEEVTFFGWYERWLDELLAGCNMAWSGSGMGGTEEQLQTVLADASSTRRVDAAQALQRHPSLTRQTTEALRQALQDPDPELRAAAVSALAQATGRGALDDLTRLKNDPAVAVRRAVARGLRKAGGHQAVATVATMLGDTDSEVVTTALYALDDAKALATDHVRALVTHQDAGVRRTALYCLGRTRSPGRETLIEEALDDPDLPVRITAIQAVRGERSALDRLITMVDSEDEYLILTNAIKRLEEARDRAAVPALLKAATRGEGFIRQDAARALGAIGDRRAVPVLQELLTDQEKPRKMDGTGGYMSAHRVCDVAKQALRRLRPWWRLW